MRLGTTNDTPQRQRTSITHWQQAIYDRLRRRGTATVTKITRTFCIHKQHLHITPAWRPLFRAPWTHINIRAVGTHRPTTHLLTRTFRIPHVTTAQLFLQGTDIQSYLPQHRHK